MCCDNSDALRFSPRPVDFFALLHDAADVEDDEHKCVFVLNVTLQTSHVNGRSSLCTLFMCSVGKFSCGNLDVQCWQAKSFSVACTCFTCFVKIRLCLQQFLANITTKFDIIVFRMFVQFVTFQCTEVYARERALVAFKAFVSAAMFIFRVLSQCAC